MIELLDLFNRLIVDEFIIGFFVPVVVNEGINRVDVLWQFIEKRILTRNVLIRVLTSNVLIVTYIQLETTLLFNGVLIIDTTHETRQLL